MKPKQIVLSWDEKNKWWRSSCEHDGQKVENCSSNKAAAIGHLIWSNQAFFGVEVIVHNQRRSEPRESAVLNGPR